MGQSSSDIKQNMKKTREKISNTVGELKANVTDTTSDTKDKLADSAADIRSKLGDAVDAVSDRAQTAQTAIANSLPLEEGVRNPLPLLIGSLIGGLAVGLLVPLSALEKERLQPVGDEIVRRASEARSEVIAQSRAVVTETVSAAKESVQTHSREAAENLGVADA